MVQVSGFNGQNAFVSNVSRTGSPNSSSSAPTNARSASAALSSYMGQNGMSSLDPNQLYQLAYSPLSGTPSTVSEAAKWMLSHPDTLNQIETHDVPGSDGIAGANDFQWAAQGGLHTSSNPMPAEFTADGFLNPAYAAATIN